MDEKSELAKKQSLTLMEHDLLYFSIGKENKEPMSLGCLDTGTLLFGYMVLCLVQLFIVFLPFIDAIT
jgi:hypothetical protein